MRLRPQFPNTRKSYFTRLTNVKEMNHILKASSWVLSPTINNIYGCRLVRVASTFHLSHRMAGFAHMLYHVF
ncbi:hypothetical protein BJX66DRAFT_311917, partial [Aspergillus keveii]